MATIPVGAHTFQTGDTIVQNAAMPAGITSAVLALDVSGINKAIGQSLVFNVFVNDGVNVRQYYASFDGPWLNKQGVLQNTSTLSISFGSTFDANGVEHPIVSTTSWSSKVVITATAGPITSSGGNLTLS